MHIKTIEEQFQLYLEKVELKESDLSPRLATELRRTFFGACGQLLATIQNDISILPDEQAVLEIKKYWDEVAAFWKNEYEKSIQQSTSTTTKN